jgi:hypothetical protein
MSPQGNLDMMTFQFLFEMLKSKPQRSGLVLVRSDALPKDGQKPVWMT